MDFTTILENGLQQIEEASDMERVDASNDGNSGSVLMTMDNGQKFLISYKKV